MLIAAKPNFDPAALEAADAPLTPGEALALQQLLWCLVAKQAERYTHKEKSSLPLETAQELLQSLCFLLRVGPDAPPRQIRILLKSEPEEAVRQGLRRTGHKLAAGKQLWRETLATRPPLDNLALSDTLRGLGEFWSWYDPQFFAHQIPASIDYPLSQPVPERLLGVDYINEWLRRLLCEQKFLACFAPSLCRRLLASLCADPRLDLINLFEPVAVNALGLTLLGREACGLHLGPEALALLNRQLDALSPRQLSATLDKAAKTLSAVLGLTAEANQSYLRAVAAGLAPRLLELRGTPGLEGVFLPLAP